MPAITKEDVVGCRAAFSIGVSLALTLVLHISPEKLRKWCRSKKTSYVRFADDLELRVTARSAPKMVYTPGPPRPADERAS
jgi:hypothetical protein